MFEKYILICGVWNLTLNKIGVDLGGASEQTSKSREQIVYKRMICGGTFHVFDPYLLHPPCDHNNTLNK